MKVLVIGGTLFIGRHLVEALGTAGHQVTVLHRNPASVLPRGVESLVADRNDANSVRAALGGRAFDCVYDNVYDWERGTTASQVEATARATASDRLERYVFLSSVGAYLPGLDLREDAPLTPDGFPIPYAANKAASERALFSMQARDGFPAVTVRPPFVYGPGNPFYREAFFWDRLRDSRPIIVPEDGCRLMQFAYVDDIVWSLLRILEEPRAVGQAFNIADAAPITQDKAVHALARAAGGQARTVHIPRESLVAAGGTVMGPNLYFAAYFDLPPITTRIDKARELLGFAPTPFDEGLRRTYVWWAGHNPFPKPDYRFEEDLLGRTRTA